MTDKEYYSNKELKQRAKCLIEDKSLEELIGE